MKRRYLRRCHFSKQVGLEDACIQIDAARWRMYASAVGLVGVKRREAEIEVGIDHADAVLRHAGLAHPLAGDDFQQLAVTNGEILEVLDRMSRYG